MTDQLADHDPAAPMIAQAESAPRPATHHDICFLCGEAIRGGERSHGEGESRVHFYCKFVDRRDV